jgi:TPR repeat protein
MDIASLHPSYPPIGDAFRVPQDYVQAYMWFNLPAEQGDQDATQSRDNVALKMTPRSDRRGAEAGAGVEAKAIVSLTPTHDGSIQMIDTSIVRLHQHGGCSGGDEARCGKADQGSASDENCASQE